MFEGKIDKFKVPAALVAATTIGFGLGRFSMPSGSPSLSVDDIQKYEIGLKGQNVTIPGVRLVKIEDGAIIISDRIGNPQKSADRKIANELYVAFDEGGKNQVKEMVAYEARIAREVDHSDTPFAVADVFIDDVGVARLKGFRFTESLLGK